VIRKEEVPVKKKIAFSVLSVLSLPLFAEGTAAPAVNSGDTAWVLASAALVLLMTVPALALFYGGLVRKKNILSVMAYSLASALIVTVLWVIGQYSLIFGTTSSDPASVRGLSEWFGTFKNVFLAGITPASVHPNAPTVPEFAYSMFQLMFAIITVALISGALVERLRFKAWFIFTVLWSLIVYTPLAHWVWNPEGVLWHMGALDFAGGLVVHTSSGVSALVAVLILGPRLGFRKTPINPPANIGYVFIGAALLWVGWFGFNSGSAVAGNGLAASAFLVTHLAAAVAGLTWMILEWIFLKKPSVVGACTGVVAGLVAITPASGFVDVFGAFVIGIGVSVISFTFMSVFRKKFKYDDALDVFSVHGLGGMWGALATGLFATPLINAAGKGVIAGNAAQLGIQALSVLMAVGIAVVGTLIAFGLTALLCGGRLRPTEEQENEGLDLSQHGEQIETD
jgi:Amt family ammonium transporter